MGAASGYGSLLKGITFIVLRNLHRLLHLAALCFLLPCLLIALFRSFPPNTSAILITSSICSILGHVFITYHTALSRRDWNLALLNADSANAVNSGVDVVGKLVFVMFSLSVAVQTKEAYMEAAQVMVICRNYGIVAMVVTVGAAMYAAQRLAMISRVDGEGKEELGRGKWGILGWSLNMVRLSTWVSCIAFWVVFCSWSSDYVGKLVAEVSPASLRLVLVGVGGASVLGFLPLLLLCIVSTKRALFFSCMSTSTSSSLIILHHHHQLASHDSSLHNPLIHQSTGAASPAYKRESST